MASLPPSSRNIVSEQNVPLLSFGKAIKTGRGAGLFIIYTSE